MRLRPVPSATRTPPTPAILARAAVAFAAVALAPAVHAQEGGVVTGRVLDASSLQPVVSARVHLPGTSHDRLTDQQGVYVLPNLPPGEVEVRVQRLGYAPATRVVEVRAGEVVVEDFGLQVSAVALDEMVVTATGLQRRRELGNSAVTVQAAQELERVAPVNLTSLLQGRAPGVQVLQSSGTVGAASSIRIRGNTSINLDNTPLVYIDGARVSNHVRSGPGVGGQTTSRLDDLNIDDIESIEIVKGPSAATLYGAEAAPGVIRITTRRGRSGMNEWTFRSELGRNWDSTDWPTSVWNPRSFFGEVYDVADFYAAGTYPPDTYLATIPDTLYTLNLLRDGAAGEGVWGTPWRAGLEQTYGAALQGGTEHVTYFISGEFVDRDGSLPNNAHSQRNARANFNVFASPNVDVAVNMGVGSNEIHLPDNDNNAFGYIGVGLLGFPWDIPIRRRDPVVGGEWMTCPLAFELHRAITQTGIAARLEDFEDDCGKNPFFSERTFDDVATLSNLQKIERLTGSATLNYRPLPFLDATGTVGYDQYSDQTGAFVPVNVDRPFGDASLGFRSIGHSVNRILTLEGNLIGTFDLHPELRSTTSVGGQFLRGKSEAAGSVGRVLPPGAQTVSSAVRTEGFESIGEGRSLGLFVQQQFGYRDRLFVTPAVRFDDSSAFGENLRRQAYPRLMASYVVSEEDWYQRRAPLRYLPSLRLRGAWGMSGQQPAAFAGLQVLAPTLVTFRDEDVAGVSLTGPGNPDLRPETAREIELGFEAGLLGDRLGLDLTWFHQVTEDAFVARPLPPSSGFAAALPTNIGEMRNRGLELGINALAWNSPSARWDWQLNWSTSRGEITRLDEPIVFGLAGNSQRHQEGFPFASYFSRTYSIQGDEVVASDSMVFVGHPTPEMEGSVSTSLSLLGRVTLYANLGFARGHQQFNSTQEFRCGFLGGGTYGGVCPEIFERVNGELTPEARIKATAAEDQQYAPWIEDADFARLRSVSARFELPARWASSVGASRASFTLEGENLALFTRYTGLDPELNFAGGAQSIRAEFLTLPPGRRVTGRLAITF